MLNPEEFFGEYPVPTVAYNSEFYDEDGFYWRGQIWLITAYIAYDTLKKHGYEEEALELKHRLLDMMKDKGGIYENYDALDGSIGLGDTGKSSCFQFGWSSSFVIEMLTDDLPLHILEDRKVYSSSSRVNY